MNAFGEQAARRYILEMLGDLLARTDTATLIAYLPVVAQNVEEAGGWPAPPPGAAPPGWSVHWGPFGPPGSPAGSAPAGSPRP